MEAGDARGRERHILSFGVRHGREREKSRKKDRARACVCVCVRERERVSD